MRFMKLICRHTFITQRNVPVIYHVKHYCKNTDLNVWFKSYPTLITYLKEKDFIAKDIFQNFDSNVDAVQILLKYCGETFPSQSPSICKEICDKLLDILHYDNANLNVEHYNNYLKMCLKTRFAINVESFLTNMKAEPNKETYTLLFELACEEGDTDLALKTLALMKKQDIIIDSKIYNNIILCHTIKGGMVEAKNAMRTLSVAQLHENKATPWYLLKGVAINGNKKQFEEILQSPIQFDIDLMLNVLHVLCKKGLEGWLHLILDYVPKEILLKHANKFELFCRGLIHENYVQESLKLYYYLLQPNVNQSKDYGIVLLKEMLIAKQPFEVVIAAAKELKDKKLNEQAFEHITEFAMREKYIDAAWNLLQHFPEKRPHYFWPLLIHAKTKGELGILNAIKRMMSMGVYPDYETLRQYCIEFCDYSIPNELYLKLMKLDLKKTDIIPPLVMTLLEKGKVEAAYDIYKDTNIAINYPKTFTTLANTWVKTGDSLNCSLLLQKLCENSSNNRFDYVGIFLKQALKKIMVNNNFNQYLNFLNKIKEHKLTITNSTSDEIVNMLKKINNYKQTRKLEELVEEITDVTFRNSKTQIPHPQDMNIQELEDHLIELQNKGMETRGVIRKLIQEHCRLKNFKRIKELRKLFLEQGYEVSPGIISSIFYSYVQSGECNEATNLYKELNAISTKFTLDTYKILDYCTLLISNNNLNEALQIIIKESQNLKNVRTRDIERNCCEVLSAINKYEDMTIIFEALMQYKYCKATPPILSPLIMSLIRQNAIDEAVSKYEEFANKYKCTPLQIELLIEVIKNGNNQLLERVIKATASIHGQIVTQNLLIAALAECGLTNPLKKLFTTQKLVPLKVLEKQFEKWILAYKLEPFKTLLNLIVQLPHKPFDVDMICSCILRIYSLKNDHEGAMNFWKDLDEMEIVPSKKLQEDYYMLLERCKYRTIDQIK